MDRQLLERWITETVQDGANASAIADFIEADEKTRAAIIAEFAAGKYAAAEARMKAATEDCERWKKAGSGDAVAAEAKP